jgi:SH3 domain-containing YSC84-like protein 1
VVARLSDGSWSAPSAIVAGGAGFGGQIGFELTDFVFVLNDASAVRTFSQMGNLTLGGNVSIAAGPVGRNAEAAGAASMKGVAGVFAYSKTKGLFAGVSLEGSGFFERKDANAKMYGRKVTARNLLEGGVPVPPDAEPLMRVLNSRAFSGLQSTNTDMYNDIPVYDDRHDDVVWEGRRGSAYGEGVRSNRASTFGSNDEYPNPSRQSRSNTWNDDVYDREPQATGGVNRSFSTRANPNETFDRLETQNRFQRTGTNALYGNGNDEYVYQDKPSVASPTGGAFGGRSGPGRPSAPKPVFGANRTGSAGPNQAIAKFTFDPDQPGDLGFKKGEIITIIKKTENETDWWTGRIGDREGIFPR